MRNRKRKLDWLLRGDDFGLDRFAWLVAEEYSVGPDDKVAVSRVGNRKAYAPLEDPDLFFSFTRLASRGKPSDKSIMRWVREHGLPKAKRPGSPPYLPNDELNQSPMGLEELAAEALQAHSALNLHADLYRGDIDNLRRRIGKLVEDYEQFRPISEMDQYLVDFYWREADEPVRRGSTLPWIAEGLLAVFVSDRVSGVRLTLAGGGFFDPSTDGYRPRQSYLCPDLFSAMYLQFFLLIANSLPVRRCDNPSCEMPFPATRKDKRFCNSTCRSGARPRR